jgi:hypothetical protein
LDPRRDRAADAHDLNHPRRVRHRRARRRGCRRARRSAHGA